mgnify:FL=1
MSHFEQIKQRIEGADRLTKLSEMEAQVLRAEYPGVPEDYLEFLMDVGYGDLGSLQLYSGLISPWQVYPRGSSSLATVLLFGDDFQGYCFGFDLADSYRVVEVDPRGNVHRTVEPRFTELLRRYFGYERGSE